MIKRFLFCGILAWGCVSCIQDEPLNAEADILTCQILNAQGQEESNVKAKPVITNNRVIVQASPKINLTALCLDLELTPGATISPDDYRSPKNYSNPQKYTVTSQDGNWHKVYTVSIDTFEMPINYGFEHYEYNENQKYQIFYEVVQGKEAVFNQYIWSSGNAGYLLCGLAGSPEDFPTVSAPGRANPDDEIIGRAAKLETRTTGFWGKSLRMPIAAGNLFIGSFDVSNAVNHTLEATLFGLPFGKKPLRFTGWYKYKPGKEFLRLKNPQIPQDTDTEIISYTDSCDIYAVLYRTEGLKNNSLNGNNVLTSKNIVAMARVPHPKAIPADGNIEGTENYEYFEVDFDYTGTEKIYWPAFIQAQRDASEDNTGAYHPFDPEELKNYKYNLAVVFTSSRYGAYFAGAVGSVLYVDDVKIICE